MTERRKAKRHEVEMFFNKYVDGTAYLAEVVEISETGMLVRRIHEPEGERATYGVELGTSTSSPFWLCASPVWSSADLQALKFLETSESTRRRLADVIASSH